jgi:transcriptional regulator with XRE-family HTH domain
MRTYIDSHRLASRLRQEFAALKLSQTEVSKALGVTQGQLSHILAGRFKTAGHLVKRICMYVHIDWHLFKCCRSNTVSKEALAALTRACAGDKRRTAVVVNVLRAIERIEPERDQFRARRGESISRRAS